ncbi:MAG: pyruvate kinase [Deltaproteobacteria bacterium]|nr:pyruvate kinase [Deltaproteobacteria bacterium]
MPTKRTKIVCTLGPASRDAAVLDALLLAGMDVARLNFSHGTKDEHRENVARLRAASARTGRTVAILQDLQGPKIRAGLLAGGRMELRAGEEVRIVHAREQSEPGAIPTTYAALARDVHVGASILMDDGLLRLRVVETDGAVVRCIVEVGGVLKDRKGINLPGVKVSADALTAKDLEDLRFGVELGVDFVCLSFVRGPDCIALARRELAALGATTPIVAKIEKPEAVAALDGILDASDGIMVARGDLGVELGPEKVPLVQKRCIEEANRRGKLVITATQMLESMVTSAFPTRAEASDVANAVLDQTDAVMLSAETASGSHPELVVRTMARIIEETESSERYRRLAELPPVQLGGTANAIAHAAHAAVSRLADVVAVVCVSRDGGTPRLLSDYRPHAPIFALTALEGPCRRLAAFWGIEPIPFPHVEGESPEGLLLRVESSLAARGIVAGNLVVTMPIPSGAVARTNTLRIHALPGRR